MGRPYRDWQRDAFFAVLFITIAVIVHGAMLAWHHRVEIATALRAWGIG